MWSKLKETVCAPAGGHTLTSHRLIMATYL